MLARAKGHIAYGSRCKPRGVSNGKAQANTRLQACPRRSPHREGGRSLTGEVAARAVAARQEDGVVVSRLGLGQGKGPWRLVGESRAGAPYRDGLAPGECARISTGAIVPPGADRVLLQEDAVDSGGSIAASERIITPRLAVTSVPRSAAAPAPASGGSCTQQPPLAAGCTGRGVPSAADQLPAGSRFVLAVFHPVVQQIGRAHV